MKAHVEEAIRGRYVGSSRIVPPTRTHHGMKTKARTALATRLSESKEFVGVDLSSGKAGAGDPRTAIKDIVDMLASLVISPCSGFSLVSGSLQFEVQSNAVLVVR